MAGFTYKSYSFTDKDPIIDEVRTMVQDSGANYNWIEEHSGVTAVTLRAWFDGPTRKPQAATINAVARALGYKLGFVPFVHEGITLRPIKIEPPMAQPVSIRHVVQMKKYQRKAK
jgi:hypothetical protein